MRIMTKKSWVVVKFFYQDSLLLFACIFIFSLLMSLVFLVAFRNVGPVQHQIPGTDYLEFYKPLSVGILKGEGVPIQSGYGIRFPIGYPIFLAGTFFIANTLSLPWQQFLIIVNAFILAVCAGLVFLLGKSVINKPVGFIAGILFASYPFVLWFVKNPHSEVPFLIFFYASMFCFINTLKKKTHIYALCAGLLLALASYMRAISFFLPALLTPLLYILLKGCTHKKRALIVVFFLGSFIIGVLPWISYVYMLTGKLIPLSSGGPSTIVGGFDLLLHPGEGGDSLALPKDVVAIIEKMQAAGITSITQAFAFLAQALVSEPLTMLKLFGIKITRAWYATAEFWWENVILIVQLCYLIPAMIGLLQAWTQFTKKRRYIIVFLVILAYFWGMAVITAPILRYVIPIMAFVFIFDGVFVYKICQKSRLLLWLCDKEKSLSNPRAYDEVKTNPAYSLDITFFVPCYNEEANVEGAIETIAQVMRDVPLTYEILICDDGSSDNTSDVVQKSMRKNPALPIRLDVCEKNHGLGFNYFRCASLARGRHYMLISGDNVASIGAIKAILAFLGKYDMVIPYFTHLDDRTVFRKTVSLIFTFLVNMLSGNHLWYYNGAVLHRTENVVRYRSNATGYGYQAELLCRLLQRDMTYREVLVQNAERRAGHSKAFALNNLLSVTKSFLLIFLRRISYPFTKQ